MAPAAPWVAAILCRRTLYKPCDPFRGESEPLPLWNWCLEGFAESSACLVFGTVNECKRFAALLRRALWWTPTQRPPENTSQGCVWFDARFPEPINVYRMVVYWIAYSHANDSLSNWKVVGISPPPQKCITRLKPNRRLGVTWHKLVMRKNTNVLIGWWRFSFILQQPLDVLDNEPRSHGSICWTPMRVCLEQMEPSQRVGQVDRCSWSTQEQFIYYLGTSDD